VIEALQPEIDAEKKAVNSSRRSLPRSTLKWSVWDVETKGLGRELNPGPPPFEFYPGSIPGHP